MKLFRREGGLWFELTTLGLPETARGWAWLTIAAGRLHKQPFIGLFEKLRDGAGWQIAYPVTVSVDD